MGNNKTELKKEDSLKKTGEKLTKSAKVKKIGLPIIIALTGLFLSGWVAIEAFTNFFDQSKFNFFETLFGGMGWNGNSWHVPGTALIGGVSLILFVTISIPLWVSKKKSLQIWFIIISWIFPFVYLAAGIFYLENNISLLFSGNDIVSPIIISLFLFLNLVWLVFNIFATHDVVTKKVVVTKSKKKHFALKKELKNKI
ncbi:hypothetical protein [Spiroplasma endosymbiont of Amphibalanus improvisus]|uniref:hypothetical protein n=1 Tax=Spiroplasma endosymbiont of Amphibalanus improvisus TaxID=3066327 RepID=UPI00313C15C6